MTAHDIETLITNSPDADDLWRDTLYLSNAAGAQDQSAFARQEVDAFVAYCMNAVESAPDMREYESRTGGIRSKEHAEQLTYRQELFHKTERDSKGEPIRARVSGNVKTWKTRPAVFEIPMKYGFKDSFRIVGPTSDRSWNDPSMWCEYEEDARRRFVDARDIGAGWARDIPGLNHLVTLKLTRRARHDPGLVLAAVSVGGASGLTDRARTVVDNRRPIFPECLDAWRSSGAWHEAGVSYQEVLSRSDRKAVERLKQEREEGLGAHFYFIGEAGPWEVQHVISCAVSREKRQLDWSAGRVCTCGAYEPVLKANPRPSRGGNVRRPTLTGRHR